MYKLRDMRTSVSGEVEDVRKPALSPSPVVAHKREDDVGGLCETVPWYANAETIAGVGITR